MTKLTETPMSPLREELLEIFIHDFESSGYSYREYASKLVNMPFTTVSSLVNRKRQASLDLLIPALIKRGLISIEGLTTALLPKKNPKSLK
jgi:hypothetical protein